MKDRNLPRGEDAVGRGFGNGDGGKKDEGKGYSPDATSVGAGKLSTWMDLYNKKVSVPVFSIIVPFRNNISGWWLCGLLEGEVKLRRSQRRKKR